MQDNPNPDQLRDEVAPAGLDDVELVIFTSMLRQQIAMTAKDSVTPELSARYRVLNEELQRRLRGQWS
jgi:hypothetical protein